MYGPPTTAPEAKRRGNDSSVLEQHGVAEHVRRKALRDAVRRELLAEEAAGVEDDAVEFGQRLDRGADTRVRLEVQDLDREGKIASRLQCRLRQRSLDCRLALLGGARSEDDAIEVAERRQLRSGFQADAAVGAGDQQRVHRRRASDKKKVTSPRSICLATDTRLEGRRRRAHRRRAHRRRGAAFA